MHNYLLHIMPPLMVLASKPDSAGPVVASAKKAISKIVNALTEDGVYLLVSELDKGLEDPPRRLAAAEATALFCKTTKLDFQEHVGTLMTVSHLSLCLMLWSWLCNQGRRAAMRWYRATGLQL